jgi:predicted ATPase
MVNQYRRDDQAVQECIEPAVHLSTEHDFAQWLAFSTTLRGWVLLQQAQYKAVIVEMCQGLAAYQATGAKMLQPYFRALLAEVYSIAGQITPGLTIVAEALELVEQTTERFHAAELHRLKGQLLLAQASDRHTEAEICFHHALDIARNQQARSLGLRAATSLARLWQQQGKCQEAHELLAPVYHWFTEGFDTADLKDAKALLDELAR